MNGYQSRSSSRQLYLRICNHTRTCDSLQIKHLCRVRVHGLALFGVYDFRCLPLLRIAALERAMTISREEPFSPQRGEKGSLVLCA